MIYRRIGENLKSPLVVPESFPWENPSVWVNACFPDYIRDHAGSDLADRISPLQGEFAETLRHCIASRGTVGFLRQVFLYGILETYEREATRIDHYRQPTGKL